MIRVLIKPKPYFKRGKQVAILRLDGVLVSHRTQEHFFRKYVGFGVSTDILLDVIRLGCHTIKIVYTRQDGGQDLYKAKPEEFLEHGIVYKDDADYQRILPIKFMEVEKNQQHNMPQM